MIFEKILLPKKVCAAYRDVTPELLTSLGVKYLICDIDNTLVTYDDPEPTPDVLKWIDTLHRAGIALAFVSNNDASRVERFNRNLHFVAYAKAGKPGGKKLRQAMAEMGAERENTALLGDQLLTDAAAANLAGLYAILVPPIRDKKTLFFRFKRWLEIPYMKKYYKLHKPEIQ